MAGAPRGAVASPDAASLTRGGAARKRRRKVDASGHSLGATEGDGARAKRETSDGDVVPVPPVGRGYPTLCRGAVRDWPALRAWTRDPPGASGVSYPRLRELVGDREVRAMVGSESGRFDGAPTRHESVKLTVSAFLDHACAEAPRAGTPSLCLAQIPLYDASAAAAAETVCSYADRRDRAPLRALWDSGDVWPVPLVREASRGSTVSGFESRAFRVERHVLDSANLWVSPGGSGRDDASDDASARFESSPHFDDRENVLCVVAGTKTVRLWSPLAGLDAFAPPGVRGRNPGDETAYNHPPPRDGSARDSREGSWTPLSPAERDARAAETLVARQGDAVYIPRGWWHAVSSARNTVAVNLWYRSAEDEALDRLEAAGPSERAGGFASDELSSRKRSVAATGAVVASARRAMRALSEQHRRSFVRRLRDAAASDAFRERASRALAACFRGDEASEPSERATLGSLAVDPEASLEGVAAENSAVSVLQTSRLALALASPPDVVLDALYDAARADPASVERSKLASFARRLRDASERLRPSSAQTARHRNSSEAADDARGETSDLSNRKCRFDRRLSCCVAAELLTSAFESHGDAFEPRADSPDGGKDGSRKGTFFETFYGAFEEEERRVLTRALHALRSVAAERSTLRVSAALGLARATTGTSTDDATVGISDDALG